MRGHKWQQPKIKAMALRRQGMSLRAIEATTKIPKTTLSGWFKKINLTKQQKERLEILRTAHLILARKKAVIWHNNQKKARMIAALQAAQNVTGAIKMSDKNTLELSLALLYMGEGSKTRTGTIMGNSNPLILKFFLTALSRIYHIKADQVKCHLYLRADQNPRLMKQYWSKQLKVPLSNFGTISLDQRTKGSATYDSYKGVCVVSCGRTDIQRKLMALSMLYCEQIISDYMGG
jgi:hypothetical protein